MVLLAASEGGDGDASTRQKKETAEEGFTNEDGSVIVSKKMTRVVTTTRQTAPGWRFLWVASTISTKELNRINKEKNVKLYVSKT